jgi:hypothetical protein
LPFGTAAMLASALCRPASFADVSRSDATDQQEGALMADERTILDAERDDSDDVSLQGILSRLSAVSKIIERDNFRLDRISAIVINPPDPDKPPIRDAVNAVKLQAQATIGKCDDLLARLVTHV